MAVFLVNSKCKYSGTKRIGKSSLWSERAIELVLPEMKQLWVIAEWVYRSEVWGKVIDEHC
jgi:hypothetical protein